jgi:hypothetical protein
MCDNVYRKRLEREARGRNGYVKRIAGKCRDIEDFCERQRTVLKSAVVVIDITAGKDLRPHSEVGWR